MTIPAGSNPNNDEMISALKQLYEQGKTSHKDAPSELSPRKPLDDLDSSYKTARSSTSENHQVSDLSSSTKAEPAKVAGIWNRIKEAISPKNEYEIEIRGEEPITRQDTSDQNKTVDLSKALSTAATGVAKLYQSAKQKFSELGDIFSGIGSTSHVPTNFKAEIPPAKSEPEKTLSKVGEEVKEVRDDEHRDVSQELQRAAAMKIWNEVIAESKLKPSLTDFAEYKNDIGTLIDDLKQPPFANEEEEAAFNNYTSESLLKIADFQEEDNVIESKIKNGEKVDLGARKEQFQALLNEYKQKSDEFVAIKGVLNNFQERVDDFRPQINQALEKANPSEKEKIQAEQKAFDTAYAEVKDNWTVENIQRLSDAVFNLEKEVNSVLKRT